MKVVIYLFLLYFGIVLHSCSATSTHPLHSTASINDTIHDPHSYANFKTIKTVHLDLELDVNFQNKTIYGVARHEMKNNNASEAIFDMRNLLIQKVTTGKIGNENTYFIDENYYGKICIVKKDEDMTISEWKQYYNKNEVNENELTYESYESE